MTNSSRPAFDEISFDMFLLKLIGWNQKSGHPRNFTKWCVFFKMYLLTWPFFGYVWGIYVKFQGCDRSNCLFRCLIFWGKKNAGDSGVPRFCPGGNYLFSLKKTKKVEKIDLPNLHDCKILMPCDWKIGFCNSIYAIIHLKKSYGPFSSHFLSVATWVGYWYLVTALFHPTNIAMECPHIFNRNIFSIGNTSSEGPVSIVMWVYRSISRYFYLPSGGDT